MNTPSRNILFNTFQLINQWITPVILVMLSVIGTWLVAQSMEPDIFDRFLKGTAKSAENSPVVLVLIDDESVSKLKPRYGNLPWDRENYIEIFETINNNNPQLMVFDSHFIQNNNATDRQFFKALRQFPNLITGMVEGEENTGTQIIPELYQLNPGVVNVMEESDGTIRRYKTLYDINRKTPSHQKISGVFPALSVASVYDYLQRTQPEAGWMLNFEVDSKKSLLKIASEDTEQSGIQLPIDKKHAFYLRWQKLLPKENRYQHSHKAIPLWHFYDGQLKGQINLDHKIALIGSSSTVYRDYHKTPMSNRHLGADIHATAMDNLLFNQGIHTLKQWQKGLILFILVCFILLVRLNIKRQSHVVLYTVGTMVIYLYLAYFILFSQLGVKADVVTPLAFIVLTSFGANALQLFWRDRQMERMEGNMEKLVSSSVLKEIKRQGQIKAGGEKREITSMFVDIRNFTHLAEHLPPDDVTDMLNEFYTLVLELVFNHRGTVDKFMGDGILIMFGAPIHEENHHELAIHAAIDIIKETEKMAKRWKQEKDWETDVGISINSGTVFVGFIGPAHRLEYTAVGDTVNTCVRLQEKVKDYDKQIIISETTARPFMEKADEKDTVLYLLKSLDNVTVRGRDGKIEIYTIEINT